MLRTIVTAALLAAVSGVTVAQAQTISQIGGPKELPPAGFKGQMYVDSRGCVFLRAGLNGTTNWVPRVSRDRKALCGYPPTMAAMAKPVEVATPAEIAAPARVADAPAPRATGKPLATVATLTTPPAIRATGPARPVDPYLARALPAPMAPPVVSVPAPARVAALPGSGATGNKIGCFTSAPVPQVVALSNGGTAVLCTRGDGTLAGAKAPVYAKVAVGEGRHVGAGLYPPAGETVTRGAMTADQVGGAARVAAAEPRIVVRRAAVDAPVEVVVPKGYKRAWTDDRLNPYRGLGTAQGQYAQDQVWTREVPAELQSGGQRVVVVSTRNPATGRLHVSSKSEPRAQPGAVAPVPQVKAAPRGGLYVQVGTFGVPANAEGAKARLRAAGLPVGTARVTRGGKALQMVMAGPFGDAGSAQSALSAARAAGFGDAYIR